MITVINSPATVGFSRNPIVYKFQGSDALGNPYQNYNVRAELRGLFVPIVQDDTIEVQWIDAGGVTESVVFTARNSPLLETHIPTNLTTGIDNYSALYQAIADAMNDHPVVGTLIRFSQTFNITSQSLWAEAIDDDDTFEISFIATLTNGASFTITNSIAPTTNFPTNYKMLIEVFFESDAGYVKVSENEAYADSDSMFAFDISGILNSELENIFPELPIPAFEDNEPQNIDIVRSYYIRYREQYDDIVSPAWTSSEIYKVLFGGVSSDFFANHNYFELLNENNSLLTWYPTGKNISIDQPEWLAFYNYTDGGQGIMLEVIWYDEDGTDTTIYKLGGLSESVSSGNVILIPVGYTQLSIDESTAVRYSVRLISRGQYEEFGGNIEYLSQQRDFYLDRDFYKEKRYIMYLNSFNCPETLRCVGDLTIETEIDRQKRNHIISSYYTASSAHVSQFSQSFDDYFTYRSGYLSKAEIKALRELLIYAKAWEISTESVHRLVLETSKFLITETRRFLNTIEFTGKYALRSENYSGSIIAESYYIVDEEGARIVDDSGEGILLGM